jgi:hypothetical protein
MTEASSEYKRGWYDGYQVGMRQTRPPEDIGRWPVGPGLVNQEYKCQKCGMMWAGVTGFSCPRQDCEIQPKVIAAYYCEKV